MRTSAVEPHSAAGTAAFLLIGLPAGVWADRMRRRPLMIRTDLLRAGDLTMDLPRLRAEVSGRNVDLTATEFQLLAALARQPGRVFTRAQLLDAIHGVAFDSYERAIDAHVKNIRRKIEPDARTPRYLLTVYGVGYRLTDV